MTDKEGQGAPAFHRSVGHYLRVHPFDAKHSKSCTKVGKIVFLSSTIEKTHIPTINVILIHYFPVIALNRYLQKRESSRPAQRSNSTTVAARSGLGMVTASVFWVMGVNDALLWAALVALLNFTPTLAPLSLYSALPVFLSTVWISFH